MKKYWKTALSLCLILVLLMSLCALSFPAAAEVEAPAREPVGTGTSGDYEYEYYADGTACITKYSGKDVELVIPAELDGHPVTTIGDGALKYNTSLISVEIPNSINAVGTNPFEFCLNLAQIIVSPDHPSLEVIDCVLFDKNEKRLITYPCAFVAAEYSIPQTTIEIGSNAFSWCDSLNSVMVPDSVVTIGDHAFSGCHSLAAITIPDSVITIGDNPFESCTKLTKITVSPDHPTLATIDGVLFEKTEKRLVTYPCALIPTEYCIPQGIKDIGNEAFAFCLSLTSVSIPDSVASIGNGAFLGCQALTSVIIPDSVTAIGIQAFNDCRRLTNVTIPDSVTFIGDVAFYYCQSLVSVTIPNSVTLIGMDAFAECPNLTLTVSRGSYAAQYCKENGLNYQYTDSLDWLLN